MFCAYTVSCHNPGLMLMDVVIVVHCPRQEKLQCDPQYFRHCGDPALGVACYAGKECTFCWHFWTLKDSLPSNLPGCLSPFVESVRIASLLLRKIFSTTTRMWLDSWPKESKLYNSCIQSNVIPPLSTTSWISFC